MMAKPERKKLFVDPSVQGALLKRIVLYWVFCLLFITVPLLIGKTFTEPDRLFFEQFGSLWSQYWPVLFTSLLLLPFVLYDVLKLSHRFTGPLVRLRREMGRLADGEAVQPLRFRDHDFWQDLADRFNVLADRMEADDREQAGEAHEGTDSLALATPEPQTAGAASD